MRTNNENPTDFSRGSINNAQYVVRKFFEEHKDSTYPAYKIADAVDLPTKQTQVQFRKIVTALIEEEGCPIVSSGKGFKWTTDPNELWEYMNSLASRQKELQFRIDAVQKIYELMTR